MEWLGKAEIKFTHANSPLPIRLKGSNENDSTSKSPTDLLQICEQSTPPCNLNPLLFNGHMHTMYTSVKYAGPPIYYKRKIFEQEDEAFAGSFAVDFAVDIEKHPEVVDLKDDELPIRTTYFDEAGEGAFKGSDDSKPMLIVLHGLSGGSYEIYLRYVLSPLIGDGGWEACVINSRGCAGHKITTGILFNARATWDIRQMVPYLRKMFPNRPLFGIGFSLGANILTNYIGEEGSNCLLKAGVIISNPFNLDTSNLALQRTVFKKQLYSRFMGGNLRRLAEKHADLIATNPRLSLEKMSATTYIHEFDREVQLGSWGYPTVGAYYRDASSVESLLAVRIPLFAINARDDPISVDEAIPYDEFKQNPYTVLCTTSLGGHLSWFEIGGSRWHAKPAVNFLNKMAFEVDLESLKTPKEINGNAAPDKFPFRPFEPMARKMRFHSEA